MKYRLTLISSLVFIFLSSLLAPLTAQGQIWGTVYTVDWSPDGSKIAVAGGYEGCDPETPSFFDSFDIQVLNTESGEPIRQLKGAKCSVTKVMWSPDNHMLAAISDDPTGLYLWNADTGDLLPVDLASHANAKWLSMSWKSDSTQIALVNIRATSEVGASVVILDVSSGQLINSPLSVPGSSAEWSPDGNTLLVGVSSGVIQLMDVTTGKVRLKVYSGLDNAQLLAWSPDSKKFASIGEDQNIRVWDAENGMLLQMIPTQQAIITDLVWNPSGKTIASTGSNRTVAVWDVTTGNQKSVYRSTQHIYDLDWNNTGDKLIYTGATFSSSDGEGGPGGTYQIVDVPQNSMISSVSAIAWTPDGTQIAVGGSVNPCGSSNVGEAGVRFLDAATYQVTQIVSVDDCTIGLLAWSAGGNRLAALGNTLTVVWDVVKQQMLYQFIQGGYFNHIGISPDGQQIAQSAIGGGYAVSNILSGNDRFFSGGEIPDWSPDGTKILSLYHCGGQNRDRCTDQILITDAVTGETVKSIAFDASEFVGHALWNVDASQISANVQIGQVESIRIWDTQSYELLKSMPLDSTIQNIHEIIWRPNSSTIAIIQGGKSEVILWDTQTGHQTGALKYPGMVFTAAWSPDGQQFAYGGVPDSSVTADLADGCELLLDNTMIVCDVNRLELE